MSKQNKFKAIKQQQGDTVPAEEMAAATYKPREDLDALFGGGEAQSLGNSLLSVDSDGVYRFGRVGLTSVGLDLPNDISLDEYVDLGRLLLDVGSRIQWLLGDFVAYGDQWEYGETYAALAEEFGYETRTLHDYAYVCRKVGLSIRIENLTFGHHQLVAAMDADQQVYWLDMASRGENGKPWSIKRMREAIKESQGKLPSPKTQFDKAMDRLVGLVGDAEKLAQAERQQLSTMLREAADRIDKIE